MKLEKLHITIILPASGKLPLRFWVAPVLAVFYFGSRLHYFRK